MANERTTRDDGKDEEVHRLRDIVVEEVSLVDRAANKRRFLVVKRSTPMAKGKKGGAGAAGRSRTAEGTGSDDETDEDKKKSRRQGPRAGDGEEEDEKKKADASDDESDEEDTRKAGASDDAEEEDDDEETEKAAGSEDDDESEEEDEEDEEDEDDEEQAGKKKAAGRSDDEEEDEEGDPKKRKREPLALTREAKAKVLGQLTEGLERLMGVAKAVSGAEEGDGSSNTGLPEVLSSEVSAVVDLLGKASGSSKSLTKGGARMARSRLDRFQKAVTLLSEILKELTEVKDDDGGSKPSLFAKGQEGGALTATLTELSKNMGELTKVVKGQQDELTRIRKARGVSNALTVDGTGRRSDPQEVSWPLDMNRPITRDNVNKATSFFDD